MALSVGSQRTCKVLFCTRCSPCAALHALEQMDIPRHGIFTFGFIRVSERPSLGGVAVSVRVVRVAALGPAPPRRVTPGAAGSASRPAPPVVSSFRPRPKSDRRGGASAPEAPRETETRAAPPHRPVIHGPAHAAVAHAAHGMRGHLGPEGGAPPGGRRGDNRVVDAVLLSPAAWTAGGAASSEGLPGVRRPAGRDPAVAASSPTSPAPPHAVPGPRERPVVLPGRPVRRRGRVVVVRVREGSGGGGERGVPSSPGGVRAVRVAQHHKVRRRGGFDRHGEGRHVGERSRGRRDRGGRGRGGRRRAVGAVLLLLGSAAGRGRVGRRGRVAGGARVGRPRRAQEALVGVHRESARRQAAAAVRRARPHLVGGLELGDGRLQGAVVRQRRRSLRRRLALRERRAELVGVRR
ncbi:hypothetical protein EYF80_049903 [Liparis tanakae]|uniref:Uncharacterized protein n=1 Tax=Liparis tanakae TaxID=230148 RepID=A0A4Z2FGN8_9TELE|nr:hypothetical protein EYF80_049903 [Liparis tanakae]